MKFEIAVIDSNSHSKGKCLEKIVRKILESHRYDITENVNFTGMEIDLIAEHKDKTSEILYVECKAKEKVSSDEITKFIFNVGHKRADHGYFFRTKELEHQAAGLLAEISDDDRYKNLTFFEPEKIIRMLGDLGMIGVIQANINATKTILIVSEKGDFIVTLISSQLNSTNSGYNLTDAKTGRDIIDADLKSFVANGCEEISSLDQIMLIGDDRLAQLHDNDRNAIENISEVQSSENWYDYLPASGVHFVGRVDIRTNILKYFKDVSSQKTPKRVFYLYGKSGWGKSSLISEIRERVRNRHYRNRFYAVAIDSRSATSDNFTALAFEKLIRKAISAKFIKNDLNFRKFNFTSNYDLLSSENVQELLSVLRRENRYLILIFDQFEDVFRKQGFFLPFYRFLSDVTDQSPNLIIGFSWKSEILIPSDNPAYHHWQQAKDQARTFEIPSFGQAEINGLIRQLENEIPDGKISKDLKRKITESSQGLPWLTKKLCIHIFRQVKKGYSIDSITEGNLNIQTLFESDLESISGDELSALKYIAKRGSEGDFFDVSEVGSEIDTNIIDSLRDKRFIVRSGVNYVVYWDIFRDYLITGDIPVIGESYLFRQSANSCLEVFLMFGSQNVKLTSSEIKDKYSREVSHVSISNIILELRNLGVLKKIGDSFQIDEVFDGFDSKAFIAFAKQKIEAHLVLKNLALLKAISISDIQTILQSTFQAYDFELRTWKTYAQNFVGWVALSGHPVKNKLVVEGRGKGRRIKAGSDSLVPVKSSLKSALTTLNDLHKGKVISTNSSVYDLRRYGVIDVDNKLTQFGEDVVSSPEPQLALSRKLLELDRIKEAFDCARKLKKITAPAFEKSLPLSYFSAAAKSSRVTYAGVLLSWLRPALNEKCGV